MRYSRQFTSALGISFLLLGALCVPVSAEEQSNALQYFDPAKGFKPAQSDLTAVFLQIAGSLEYYGSPEPYLRHMKAEHARIEAKYQKQLGDKAKSFCPVYMDAAYLDRFTANWRHIAPQLGLELLTKNTGHLMQAAINGPDGKGTALVKVFNEHQHQVHVAMTSKKAVQISDFASLNADLVKCLQFNEPPVQVMNLAAGQQAVVGPASNARMAFLKLFSAVDAGLAPTDAEKVKAVLLGIVADVGCMAESEMKAAKLEESIDYLRSEHAPYSAEQEIALNAEERKTYIGFLKKPRFTKADLAALDRFYSTIYDKLTERGKDEMSKRLHAGMRPES